MAMTVAEKAKSEEQQKLLWQELSLTVQKGHEDCEQAFATVIPSGVHAGLALSKAKAMLDPDQWRRWLKSIGVPIRKAELYVKLAT